MQEQSCCVTGHRNVPTEKAAHVKARLKEELETAIADGFTTFFSGFADGVDLWFAQLVLEQREKNPALCLVAVIPYRRRMDTKDAVFQQCLHACLAVHIQRERYTKECFLERNRYMVEHCARVIAAYDGRSSGGTLYTMHYAKRLGRDVREIRV